MKFQWMTNNPRNRHFLLSSCATGLLAFSMAGYSQDAVSDDAALDDSDVFFLEDIVVTAQKRGVAEAAQKVPIAITALNASTIERNQVRDLASLNATIPNVSLSSVNTIPGFANFEIRGFGINSSIPSVEPAVGVFVDGVYYGQTSGVILDLFDLESIEVMRGPQGTLFGRNTTGGAVSIRTQRPGDEFAIKGKVSFESGPQYTGGISVEGPISPNLKAKLTGYVTHDTGYFYNATLGRDVGKKTISFIRPTIVWEPSSSIDTTLIYEKGSGDGDGAVSVNPSVSSGFDPVYDFAGFFDLEWQSLTSETNVAVDFGEGLVTSIVGWREMDQLAGEDLDGTSAALFHPQHNLTQNQLSAELRYAGTFGALDITVGSYFFKQDYTYVELRDLVVLPAPSNLGGRINQDSFGFFGQGQFHFTETFSLIAGGRYSWEKKQAEVAVFSALNPRCDFTALTCDFNFPGPSYSDDGSNIWKRFSPKLGFQWVPHDNVQVYGNYSEGIRSGGYNVRSTAPTVSPGPYDEEIQKSFEVGLKTDLLEHHLRINLAAFHNTITDLQRDVSIPDPGAGTVQITRNAGDARIQGFEIEMIAALSSSFIIGANLGYLDGDYTLLNFDINRAAEGFGLELGLARLAPWSYGGYATYSMDVSDDFEASARVQFGHRDSSPFNDLNTGFINSINNLEANISLGKFDDSITFVLYGKNLLNEVWNGAEAPLPGVFGGGSFFPINKGRHFGIEVRFKM